MKKNLTLALGLCSAFLLAQSYTDKVGINTNEPIEKLQVNGTMQVDKIKFDSPIVDLDPTEDYTFLVKDNTTQKIQTYNTLFNADGNNTAPLNLIQFNIDTDSNDKDWIREFNTKINSDKYAVIISSFGFNLAVQGDTNYGPLHQIYAYDKTTTITETTTVTRCRKSNNGTLSQCNTESVNVTNTTTVTGEQSAPDTISTYEDYNSSGQNYRRTTKKSYTASVVQHPWKLKADYDGFRPPSGATAGRWNINLLVFDRTYAKMQAEKTIDMNGATIGTGNILN